MKILLVEDDIMLNEMITEYITSTGHAIKSVKTGNESLEILDKEKFDLLILDINLPDIEDISRAFDLGCFDYLKKPFHLKELTLRINKILKTRIVPQRHKRLSKHYSFDAETMTLLFNNEPHILPKRQLQIIELLALNRSLVVQYDMFRDYDWNDDYIDNATIRAEVNRVKTVLKEDFIKNIRGSGYMIERPE